MIKLWWHRLTTQRIAFKICDYETADELLREDIGWELAKEEDTNGMFNMVYLEIRE